MSENIEMRAVLCNTLDKIMSENEKIVFIDSDLARANGTLPLHEKYPERAFDVGIAEQNMAAMAAGMAAYGFIPFISSFTPFATRRICDQVAISIAYAHRNVKIVGSDPGITAELNGGTHMSVEDIGVLRSIPTMVIVEPCDAVELEKALPQIIAYEGVVYLRLFRKAAPTVYTNDYKFDLFKADIMREGSDVSIFASGFTVHEALKAYDELKNEGIHAEIINVHTVKPIHKETVVASAKKTGRVITCDNHNIIGGLGSAVAEVLIEEYPVKMKRLGIPDCFGEVAKVDYLKNKFKMSSNDIKSAVYEMLK